MHQLKIAMGDLRHKTIGKHSVFMPIGVGYIASYTLSQLGKENVDINLYEDPENILKAIEEWQPHIVALSNYCWNSEVSQVVLEYAKRLNPEVICVMGGPDFPVEQHECKNYLLNRTDIDFYTYLEGEIPFAKLSQKIASGTNVKELKSTLQEGIMSIHPETKQLVVGEKTPRLLNMDDIPSPYLNGLMDQWFDGSFIPLIETARGCPFQCSFCFVGQSWYSKVGRFTTDRISQEFTYMAERLKNYPNILLGICDSNFGMYERDEILADHLSQLQDTYNWPNAFTVTTGKANYDRILGIVEKLKNKMRVSTSVQSLNNDTLKLIKRKNVAMGEYQDVQLELKKRGQYSMVELIIPMPGETKHSFFEGVEILLNAGVGNITVYTTMMLRGTELGSQESRIRHGMKTKWRIVPRQFGTYYGQKTFEVEEVCIATNTMTFDEYLECRGFALICAMYSGEQFDTIARHLQDLEIPPYDFVIALWQTIHSGQSNISKIYDEFIEESQTELWDSKEALIEYFSKEENYNKLLAAKFGDNLIRKYRTNIYIEKPTESLDMAYALLLKLAPQLSPEIEEFLDAAKQWAIGLRDLGAIARGETDTNHYETLLLPYDVQAWYASFDIKYPVSSTQYKKHSEYRTYFSKSTCELWRKSEGVFGKDSYFHLAKILTTWSVKELWRKCELVDALPPSSDALSSSPIEIGKA